MNEYVVLVDENDKKLGIMEKQEAHVKGLLHRAFSVFIFNKNKETLIQQRATNKYHSPLKWTNACCSHPRDGESYKAAAHRRLNEELGFDCELEEMFHFIYKAEVGDGLTEHELDHVFCGYYENKNKNKNKNEEENEEDNPKFNTDEVNACKWISLEDLKKDIKINAQDYTEWFKIIFNEYTTHLDSFVNINKLS